MRIAVLAAALAFTMTVGAEAGHARYQGPWCMHMIAGDDIIEERCDMRSYEMCRAEMMGLSSAYCIQNPYYYARAYEPRRPHRTQRWHRR